MAGIALHAGTKPASEPENTKNRAKTAASSSTDFAYSSGPQSALGMGLGLSTTGLELSFTKSIHEYGGWAVPINIRTIAAYAPALPLASQLEFGGMDFVIDGQSQFGNASLLVDIHPLDNPLRVSLGGHYNRFSVQTNFHPKQSIFIGEVEVTPEEMGNLNARVSFPPVGWRFALGWGNAANPEKRLGFHFDAGALFQGFPRVEMQGEGMFAPTGEGSQSIQNALRKYPILQWYPYLAASLGLRLG